MRDKNFNQHNFSVNFSLFHFLKMYDIINSFTVFVKFVYLKKFRNNNATKTGNETQKSKE